MRINVKGHEAYAYTANRPIEAARPSVVFIHGAANDHSVWALQSRYFAYHGWNAVAVDLPGHGKSAGDALSDIGALAEWVIAFLEAAAIRQCCLVGHSMGSLVGLEAAARHPSRISRLVLVGTAVPMAVSEALLQSSAANDHAAYELINVFSHSPRAQIGGNRLPGVWMMGNSMRLMERSANGVLHSDFTACNDYAGGLAAAARVKCPVLVIVGRRDLMTPPRAAAAAIGKLDGARTLTLEGTGHALMSEQPDAVLDALIEFLGAASPANRQHSAA